MQLPDYLRNAAEEYALTFGHKALAKAAADISSGYRDERADGSELVSAPADIAAYAAVRMPATFAAVSSALEHALTHFRGSITTAADIGAGTGAAAWAAALLIDGLGELHCFERVKGMRELGEKLMTDAEIPADVRWHSLDITKASLPQSYGLITAGYILNELKCSDREAVIRKLWDKTEGMLLIVEPGTMKGWANIKEARELLIQSGAGIAYPCPGDMKCPLPDGDWCHFTARAARSKLHKLLKGGDVPYEDEKFSCLAAVRERAEPCEARILRHPQISGGVVGLHVCTSSGISDIKVTKSSKDFKTARKSSCGDAVRLS